MGDGEPPDELGRLFDEWGRLFDCVDCGRRVIAWGPMLDEERCNSCAWIRLHIDPDDQDKVRELLGVPLKAGR